MNLTKPQKLIYDMEKFAGGAIAVICGSMLVNGKKDLAEIKKAVNELYRLNAALRIRIVKTDGEVLQTVCDYAEQDFNVLCFENKAELDAYAEDYAKKPLDFYGNLCAINIVTLPEQYGLLIKLHHIIGDAWTLSLLGTQFNKLINGEEVEAYSYADYIESENTYIQSKRYEKDKAFFVEQFKKCDEVTYLSEKQSDSLNACRKTFVIGKEQTSHINTYAQRKGTSAFMLFTAALATYINRVKMNAEKFYIGTAVLNRSGVKENNTVGMFVNTAPMLMELDNNKSFANNLSTIEDTAFSVFRHQKYNYGDVLSTIRKEFNFTEKLYDVMISYQNAIVTGAEIETTWYHSGSQSESLQIHIDDRDNEGIFRIHYDYLTDKFTENEIERLHQHICNLLFDAICDDSKKLYELNILSADEKQKLLYEFNNTVVNYPRDKCVHQLFEEQVVKTPDKIAVIACDKTMTYSELNEQANKIAHALIEKGVGVGDVVAFALQRKSYLIATMLGILKSGAAYLPVDPDYPQDRIDYMLADSNAKSFVTEDNIQELLANDGTSNPSVEMSSNGLCYCIYTSGSTGKPKGTSLYHYNLVNLLSDNEKYFDGCNSVALLTTICFDVASQEIFCALLYGLKGYLFQNKSSLSVQEVCETVQKQEIDVIFATPTYFDMLTQTKQNTDLLLGQVKVVILAGEQFYLNDYVESNVHLNETIFLNQYGPAETHVCSCCVVYSKDVNSHDYTTITTIHAFTPSSHSFGYILKNATVHQLFEEQAAKTPDRIAVVACDKTLTYTELNEQANRIAHSLIEQGIGVGDIVAFSLPRRSYLLPTMMGILKSGAVYLPIDPDYPQERIDYMISDSKAKMFITENNIAELFANNKTDDPKIPMDMDNLCYCIYTSGSTGKPKGTLLTHKSVTNYTHNNNNVVHKIIKSDYERIVSVTTVGFDIFVTESLLPLVNGIEILLANEEQAKIQSLLNELLCKTPVDVLQTTPTKMKSLIIDKDNLDYLKTLKVIILGGEAVSEELVKELFGYTDAKIFNIYGPTETTVWSTNAEIKNEE